VLALYGRPVCAKLSRVRSDEPESGSASCACSAVQRPRCMSMPWRSADSACNAVPAGDEDDWRSWKTVGDNVLHIELRRWADAMLIAPLSANTLAKVANGMCDNLLTCVVRAWDWQKPLLVRSCCPHKLFHVQD